MLLADKIVLDGMPAFLRRSPSVELRVYKNDEGKLECFQFSCREDDDIDSIFLPVSQIDNVMAMLQKIKDQQANEA